MSVKRERERILLGKELKMDECRERGRETFCTLRKMKRTENENRVVEVNHWS